MELENTNMNIPTVSVSEVTTLLGKVYTNAVNNIMPFKEIPTAFLWGSAGIGKSEGVYQLADIIGKNTGKSVTVTDVRLLLFSPVDLRGVPVADSDRKFTNWLMPRIFDMDGSKDVINILFLDELSAAPQSVQAAAYQICLDRKIGEHKLPDNCIVIAADNRTTDKSVSYKMPKALCNRLMHFEIRVDFTSWKDWAYSNGIDERIIGYLSFDNSKFCVEPETSDMAYPTPRSWSFASNILKAMDCTPKDAHSLISGCVGNDTALEFENWCRVYRTLPSVDDIMKGRNAPYPKTHDALFALTASLVTAVRSKGGDISLNELENVCAYAKRFPSDFAMSFFKDILADDNIRIKSMKCQSFNEWFKRNKQYI